MNQILKGSSRLPRAFLLAVLSSAAAVAPGTAAADPVVETASGPVMGVAAGGVDRFLGSAGRRPPVAGAAAGLAPVSPCDATWFGTPAWPAYAAATDTYQSLAPPSAPETGFVADHKCALWAP